jgi:hypothetical protein
MAIVTPGRRVYGGGGGSTANTSRQQQPNTPVSDSASWDHIPSPQPYAWPGGSGALARRTAVCLRCVIKRPRLSSAQRVPRDRTCAVRCLLRPTRPKRPRPAPNRLFLKERKSPKRKQPSPDDRQVFRQHTGRTRLARAYPFVASVLDTFSGELRGINQSVLYAAAVIHRFDTETDATTWDCHFLRSRSGIHCIF